MYETKFDRYLLDGVAFVITTLKGRESKRREEFSLDATLY